MTNRSLAEAKFDPPAIIHDVTNPTDVPHPDLKIRCARHLMHRRM
jgi:hypothetical protein